MMRFSPVCLIVLTTVLSETSTNRADVIVRVPFVNVEVGNGVRVQAPFVNVQVPPVVPAPTGTVVPPVVVPAPPPSGALRPLTLPEFAASFQPAPGNYEVLLVHSRTGCPVQVGFTLPCGCPRKVRVTKHQLVFDYGRDKVTIRFGLCGQVRVLYH